MTHVLPVKIECRWGYEEAMQYINGLKKNVMNDEPVIGPYGVNRDGSGDMDYKGALMINTIRHIMNADERRMRILKECKLTFRLSIVISKPVIADSSEYSGLELHTIIDQ